MRKKKFNTAIEINYISSEKPKLDAEDILRVLTNNLRFGTDIKNIGCGVTIDEF